EMAQPQPKASIPTNVMEFDDRYELMLSVPSRDRTDVEISIEEDVLSIKVAAVEKDANYRLREWTTNETTKRFKLSANVDQNAVKATVHSGVLTITLPKTLIDSIKTKREIEIH
ncbi:MAG: Hsp20/alpha crystallin family protein, partial [Bacteroidota bacterium]